MVETPSTVSAWANATFGEAHTNAPLLARANLEMGELLIALAVDDRHPKALEECADVSICLYRYMDREGLTYDSDPIPHDPSTSHYYTAAMANQLLARAMGHVGYDDRSIHAQLMVFQALNTLAGLARSLGGDLEEAIARKMEINRHARTWEPTGDGLGRHVET